MVGPPVILYARLSVISHFLYSSQLQHPAAVGHLALYTFAVGIPPPALSHTSQRVTIHIANRLWQGPRAPAAAFARCAEAPQLHLRPRR